MSHYTVNYRMFRSGPTQTLIAPNSGELASLTNILEGYIDCTFQVVTSYGAIVKPEYFGWGGYDKWVIELFSEGK